jgi:predicted 2-oxoglutarate/Fe(II)-dependent dioxygenase YbiX
MKVFRQTRFLTAEECLVVRRGMDRGQVEQAEILRGGVRQEPTVRVAALVDPDSGVIRFVESALDACRDRVSEALGLPLGDREGAGFIRYPAGGFYRPHRDRGDDPGWEAAARRSVALVLFLNTSRASGLPGEFDGGLLRLLFADADVDVVPEAGLLVAFPADVLHEVTAVCDGTRDAVADWFYSPASP